jgi:hypothetical protein
MVLRSTMVVNPRWRWNRTTVGKQATQLRRPDPARSVKWVAAAADVVVTIAICTDSGGHRVRVVVEGGREVELGKGRRWRRRRQQPLGNGDYR